MKKIKNILKKTKVAVIASLVALTAFVISCEIPQDAEDILELRLDTNVFKHKVFLIITDPVDQTNLSRNTLTAKLSGPDADKIVSEAGNKNTTWSIKNGLAGFAVNPKFAGFSTPLEFDIEISGNGYLTKTVSVTIKPEDAVIDIRETMMNVNSAPSGVATASKTASLANGSNSSAVTVDTNSSTSNTAAQVTVPAGNTFKDANGNTISGGSLKAQVVYFDGNEDAAARSSNNQNVKTVVDKDGNTVNNAVFSAVATADINMQVGSTEVKEFGAPIDVCLDINSDYINPATGAKVKAGDKFNIYSTSDASGNWTYEKEGTVIDSNGKLKVVFTTNHLSTFTIGTVVNLCSDNFSVIPLPNNGEGFGSIYWGSFKRADDSIIALTGAAKGTIDGKSVLFVAYPPSEPAKLVLVGGFTSQVIDWCGSVSVDPTSLETLKLQGETVEVDISAKCGDSASIRPSGVKLYIEYNAGSETFVEVGTMQNGKISIPGITLGREYKLRVYYDGNSGDGTYTFDSTTLKIENYDLPGDLCDEIGL